MAGLFSLWVMNILMKHVDFSLTGKAPHCECEEQGSSPEVNLQNWLIVQWKNTVLRTQ